MISNNVMTDMERERNDRRWRRRWAVAMGLALAVLGSLGVFGFTTDALAAFAATVGLVLFVLGLKGIMDD